MATPPPKPVRAKPRRPMTPLQKMLYDQATGRNLPPPPRPDDRAGPRPLSNGYKPRAGRPSLGNIGPFGSRKRNV